MGLAVDPDAVEIALGDRQVGITRAGWSRPSLEGALVT